MDPSKPITVSVEIDSPQVVVYRLWYAKPGDTAWTTFATGTDEAATNPSAHHHTVGPLPEGSKVAYHVIISGAPATFYRVRFTASQEGNVIGGGTTVDGYTNEKGAAAEEGEVAL